MHETLEQGKSSWSDITFEPATTRLLRIPEDYRQVLSSQFTKTSSVSILDCLLEMLDEKCFDQ